MKKNFGGTGFQPVLAQAQPRGYIIDPAGRYVQKTYWNK